VNFQSNEGGEVRWEYLEFDVGSTIATDRARATAFFFKGATPNYPLPDIPGCTHYPKGLTPGTQTRWPLAQDPARQYLDVGQVIITGGPVQYTVPAGAANGGDALGRTHAGPWKYNGGMLNNMGRNYITDNTTYDVILTGSSEWPAQVFNDVLYMPDYFPLISPAKGSGGPTLVANTPFEITYTAGANTAKPAGMEVDTLIAFTDGNPPLAICVEEGTDGSITIPAATVDYIIANKPVSGGRFLRQHVVHQLRELTNGTTHENKRIDFLSVWCYNYPYQ
jgi:hypothetical protein